MDKTGENDFNEGERKRGEEIYKFI